MYAVHLLLLELLAATLLPRQALGPPAVAVLLALVVVATFWSTEVYRRVRSTAK